VLPETRSPAALQRAATCCAPFSLEKMSYDPETCAVIYRSRMHKTLKRNFQLMHGADWLVQLCAHIPDRFEHLVRYAGWYSNRSRGKRRRMEPEAPEIAPAKSTFARPRACGPLGRA